MISSILKWALGVALALCIASPTLFWMEVNRLEKPVYELVKTIRAGPTRAELRDYAPYLIAESVVSGETLKQGNSKGFLRVADYIFGNNVPRGGSVETREKIAMTAPVRTEQPQKLAMTSPVRTEMGGGPRTMKVSFVMPRKYGLETLPKPKSRDVKIRSIPGHRLAVVRFRGRSPDEGKVAEVSRGLFAALEANGLTPRGDLMVYQYHPPFMPGFLRRNEVAVKV